MSERCAVPAVIPFMKTAGWGRITNISGGNARNAGNLSGGARNAGLVHMTKTLAVQLGRRGITADRALNWPPDPGSRNSTWALPK
jgi:NAD(P)-dependent dehydrogenase (short-subunit alcohol dehydrogenase family)